MLTNNKSNLKTINYISINKNNINIQIANLKSKFNKYFKQIKLTINKHQLKRILKTQNILQKNNLKLNL